MNRSVIIAAAVVSIAALADLWVTLRPGLKPIPADAMQAARTKVLEQQRPGDRVVHSPLFTVRELAPLGDLRATPDKPPADVMSSRRILLIDREDAPMGGFATPSETIDLPGALTLKIFAPSGDGTASLYALLVQFDANTLHIERPRGRVASRCTQPRAEGGYACPGQPEWLYVARRDLTIDGKSRACLWAHPTNDGAVVFTIPAQPAAPPGRALALTVGAGLADDAVNGTPDGAPVQVDVEQNGRVGQVRVPNRVGWYETTATIAGGAAAQIVITTARDGRRHLCIDATIEEVRVQ